MSVHPDTIMLQVRDRTRAIVPILIRRKQGTAGFGDARELARLREERRLLQAKLPPLRLVD